jgi:hypothetical protein
VLRNGIEQESAAAEHGLTVLASAGSAAPYVGLFGTVWGIYHALVQIGLSGQGTLDKVAGPVGEALIMTALGLAVAIPAVLAYNAFNRRNRMWLARLESFAHDLYVLLTVARAAMASRWRPLPPSGAEPWPGELRPLPAHMAPMADMNVVPLVDVMLVLLVIFIVTAPLLTHAVKIDLPKASSSSPNITRPNTSSSASAKNGEPVLERREGGPG